MFLFLFFCFFLFVCCFFFFFFLHMVQSNWKQFLKLIYLTHRYDPNKWTWKQLQWRNTQHSPDLQKWSLTSRCSLVSCPEHLFFWRGQGVSYSSAEYTVSIFLCPADRGRINNLNKWLSLNILKLWLFPNY